MFCPKCGNEVPEGSSFCSKCGNPINLQRTDSTQPIQQNQVSDAGTAEKLSEGIAPTKKKKIMAPAIAVLLVAVIGVAAAFATDGFGLLGDSGSNESIEESDVTIESEDNTAESEDSTRSDGISVEVKGTVEEYTWEELSAISAEIATASDEDAAIEIAKTYNLVNEDGTLDGTQTKSVTLTDGTVTSVQIAGFVHDDKSDGSGKAGITFIFADAIAAEMYMNSDGYNTGGWESSDMRSWLTSDGKALLPEELQDVIVAVDKCTNNVGYVGTTDDASSVVTTTSDELWLFSCVELVGDLDESWYDDSLKYLAAIYNAEGSQYKFFRDCGVSFYAYNDVLAKAYLGYSYYWWERSPNSNSHTSFMAVDSDGYPGIGYRTAVSLFAVVPGFCI